MAIIRKAIGGLNPGSDYLFTVKPKNIEIVASDDEQESIRVSIPTFSGTPSTITGLQLASNFQSVIFKFDIINDRDLSYFEYQLYDNSAGTGDPINAVYSKANGQSSVKISGTNTANVFLVAVDNSTQSINPANGTVTNTVKQYWGRVRSVNTAGNPSTNWSSLVASGELALIGDTFISNLTAAKITSGTISATKITMSGANSIIQSSTYDGVYDVATNKYTTGSTGWLISGNGQAIFDASQIRGAVSAGSININTYNYWQPSGSSATFQVGSAFEYLYFNGTSMSLSGSIYASGGTIGGWGINPSSISSSNGNVTLSNTGQFTIGSDSNDRAVITSNGDFTITGYDSSASSYGITNFYGPWFKIVKGNDINANEPQAQLTWRDLFLADNKGTNGTYTDYIGIVNPSNSESRFLVVSNSNTKVYLSPDQLYIPDATSITASNAYASFGSIGVTSTILAGSSTALLHKVSATVANVKLGGWNNDGTVWYNLDSKQFTNAILFPGNDLWMHYYGPAGGPNNWGYGNKESWTAAIINDWDTSVPGYPNPYTLWGITRDGWKGYIYQYYTGNSYSSRTITGASDRRVKDNIQPLNSVVNPLNIVDNIEPKIYDYLHYRTKKLDENGNTTEEWNETPKKFGFIAQDLVEELGEYKDLVTDQVKDPNYDFPIYTTEDRGIIAILWAAVRDLSAKVKELEER